MMRFFRDLRLVPIVVLASACLLALKAAEFVLDRGYLGADAPPSDVAVVRGTPDGSVGDPSRSWAQQMFNFPDARGTAPSASAARSLPAIAPLAAEKYGDITGSVGEPKAASKENNESAAAGTKAGTEKKEGKDAKPAVDGTLVRLDGPPQQPASERAILERLQERRQELEARARELDIREGLVQAAEKRVEVKLTEIKEVQTKIAAAAEKKDEAEAARFKSLVTMYENMKPRDAAKIFDRLEIGVLIEVASQINPRRMADILALMAPDSAERLTVELANRAQMAGKSGGTAAELPKIEGRPSAP